MLSIKKNSLTKRKYKKGIQKGNTKRKYKKEIQKGNTKRKNK